MTKRRRKPTSDRMEHVDLRAPAGVIEMWRERARASGMTFSEWARHGLNGTPTYTKPNPVPVTDDDEAP